MKTRTLSTRIIRSLAIWGATNVIGAVLMFAGTLIFNQGHVEAAGLAMLVFMFGLLFSAPVNLILPLALKLLDRTSSKEAHIVSASFMILGLCGLVILFTLAIFDMPLGSDDSQMILVFCLPYVLAAMISFFLVEYRHIAQAKDTGANNTHVIDANIN